MVILSLVAKKKKDKNSRKENRSFFKFKVSKKSLKFALIGTSGIIFLLLLAFGIYSLFHTGRAFANIKIGDQDFSGKNRAQISEQLKILSENYLKEPLTLEYKSQDGKSDKTYTLDPADIALAYDIDKTTEEIYGIGRNNAPWQDLWAQLKTVFIPIKLQFQYSYNNQAVDKFVADIASALDDPEKDYTLSYDGGGKFSLNSNRKSGSRIDSTALQNNIINSIATANNLTIQFKKNNYEPKITPENAEKTLANANQILSKGQLKLVYEDQSFVLDVDTIAGLIGTIPNGDQMEIYLIQDRVQSQVDAIAEAIDVDAVNATLTFKNGKVDVYKTSVIGKTLNSDQVEIDIENAILSRISQNQSETNETPISLAVSIKMPEVNSTDIEKFGLVELVGSGTTAFYGSPSNRIHNITIGAAAINGALIKPGEEFSTLSRLGEIDAKTGYLPELVIRDNRTVPEYGGGLCQVSTTLFRAALNTGMEITQRQNHKYRVSYYEPPIGMDATIYDPAPDFRFINNYSSYILIQAKVVGTTITFEFYGTKDTRKVTVGTPVAYNYVQPGDPIETETDTLAPGEKKLLEHSHAGASAKFHYKVERSGKILQEKDFISKYVAWPEKWLVGKAVEEPKTDTKTTDTKTTDTKTTEPTTTD